MQKKEIKKNLYKILNKEDYTPLTKNSLIHELGLKTKKEKRLLKDLLFIGKVHDEILKNEEGQYYLPPKVVGQLSAHTRGFGFVRPEDNIFEEDVFIAPYNINGAFDKDKVVIEVFNNKKEGRKVEGRVVDILERGYTQVVGIFEKLEDFGFVIVDNDRLNKDIYIKKEDFDGAESGDKVVVEITKWPEHHLNPEGKIIEVLGKPDERGVDIMSIIKSYAVPTEFPTEVLQEAEALGSEVDEKEFENRLDLRDQTIFTIDGDSTKDFDDAVSIEKLDNGNYRLGVHIADVSHYVTEDSFLDQEALKRGTSIYAVDKVVPMLPEALSNGLCSLMPDVDRLTYSCIMEVNPKGEVVDYDIKKSVIHSNERMTYRTVNEFLDGNINSETEYLVPYKKDLELMQELAHILRTERRDKRGSIDFEFEEAYITVDDNGKPVEIKANERGVSERLIEEFMLLANETVATYTDQSPLSFMYRNHPKPDTEKLSEFRKFIGKLGLKLGERGEMPTNADYVKLLEDVKGKPYENVVTLLALRTMQQAVYEGENKGHFALGAPNYTHFTSPIRRYPDLSVHRNLTLLEENPKFSKHELKKIDKEVKERAKHSSQTERTAVEIEREVDKLKKAEFMRDRIGQRFKGRISGVTGFGLFVELPNTVEGLIRMHDLNDDYYYLDEDNHRLIGENHGRIYSLGDDIEIEVDNVNVEAKQIDFKPFRPREEVIEDAEVLEED